MSEFLEFLTQFEADEPVSPETWLTLLERSMARFQMLSLLLQEQDHTVRDRNATALRAFLKVLKTLRQHYAPSLRQVPWASGEPVELLL